MRNRIMGLAIVRMLVVVISTMIYWKIESVYFSNLSVTASLVCTTVFVSLLMFGWAYSLFSKLKGASGSVSDSAEEIELSIREEMGKKISLLEHRVFELKGENNILKNSSQGSVSKTNVPDQKLSILTQQRVFLHDLATKIQILQGATDAAMAVAKSIENDNGKILTKRLEMINRNLEQVIELHKVNREFIILAA
jgi:hypothetical protein